MNTARYSFGALADLADECYRIAAEHGFHDAPNPVPQSISLIHAETSEALEEHRAGRMDLYYRESDGKPEGFGMELADILIRVLDTMCEHNLNPDAYVIEKMQFNATRPHKHGKEY